MSTSSNPPPDGIRLPFVVSEADFRDAQDSNLGWCASYKAFTHESAEPDARKYECPDCGAHTVFGVDEALLEGLITIEPDSEEGDDNE